MNKLRNISYSKISTFLSCGERFRRRYINKEPSLMGIPGMRGRAIHKGIEIANKNKMLGKNNDINKLIAFCLDEFEKGLENVYLPLSDSAEETEEKKILAKDQIARGIKLYINEGFKNIDPVAAEEHLEYDFGNGKLLHGYFDCIGKNNTIWDFKTTAKTPPDDDGKYNIQGTVYAMIYNQVFKVIPSYKILYLILLKKSEKIKIVEKNISIANQDIILKYCDLLQKSIDKDIFLPADPGGWVCSEKYCDFYNSCQYTDLKRGKLCQKI